MFDAPKPPPSSNMALRYGGLRWHRVFNELLWQLCVFSLRLIPILAAECLL